PILGWRAEARPLPLHTNLEGPASAGARLGRAPLPRRQAARKRGPPHLRSRSLEGPASAGSGRAQRGPPMMHLTPASVGDLRTARRSERGALLDGLRRPAVAA